MLHLHGAALLSFAMGGSVYHRNVRNGTIL